jgi:hypothetical protein
VLAALALSAFGLSALGLSVGTLAGRVVDADGLPVAGATVVPFEREHGLPLHHERLVPFVDVFLEDGDDRELMRLVHAVTDAEGHFRIERMPAGAYRVVAQTWDGAEQPVTEPLQTHGELVWLRGVIEEVPVPSAAAEDLFLAPLGDATLMVDHDCGNDESLMVVSRAPTSADPVLGFAGWAGPFMRGLLAANRMPDCLTTVRGLPPGKVYAAFFSADNNPGFGDAALELVNGETTRLTQRFVAGWSDARHDPPAALAELVEEVANLEERPAIFAEIMAAVKAEMDRHPARRPFAMWTAVVPFLDRQVEWPDGRTLRLADLLAADAYVRLQRYVGKRED